MRVALVLSLLVSVSGCDRVREIVRPGSTQELTLPPPLPDRDAQPVLAVLEDGSVFVEMDDGVQCLGASGAALSSAGWSGTLSECVYAYPYQVELTRPDEPVTLGPCALGGLWQLIGLLMCVDFGARHHAEGLVIRL